MKILIIVCIALFLQHAVMAQDYQKIIGVVVDQDTTPISFANVYIDGTGIGVATNEFGQFEISIPDSLSNDSLHFSSIGYNNMSVHNHVAVNLDTIVLKKNTRILDEVVISAAKDSLNQFMRQVFKKIHKNLSNKQFYLEGFYRELAIKDSTYIRMIEAAFVLQDFGVKSSIEKRRYKILELRKSKDNIEYGWRSKLFSFLFGDKNMLLDAMNRDFIRKYYRNNKLSLLDKNSISKEYLFNLDNISITNNGREIYTISFNSDPKLSGFYTKGYLVVNVDDLAILEFEHGLYANPKHKIPRQEDFFYKGEFFTKHKVKYRKVNKKYYPYFVQAIRPINFDAIKNGKGQQYASYTIMVNNIVTKKRGFDRIRKKQKEKKDVDLYEQNFQYHKIFWKHYNILLENPLFKKVGIDLERKSTLEEQFNDQN